MKNVILIMVLLVITSKIYSQTKKEKTIIEKTIIENKNVYTLPIEIKNIVYKLTK